MCIRDRTGINEQDLILGVVMKTEGKITINIDSLKRKAKEVAPTLTPESDWDGAITKLLSEVTVQAPAPPPPAPAAPPPGQPPATPAKKDGKN